MPPKRYFKRSNGKIRLMLTFLFFLAFNANSISQSLDCRKNLKSACRYLLKDRVSLGPSKGFDSAYYNRVIDKFFNRPLILSYFQQDTLVFTVQAKMENLQGGIAYLDVILDETGLKKISMMPTFSKGKIDSMEVDERRMYGRALNVYANLKKRKILIGVILFDERCKLTGYINAEINLEDAEVLKKIMQRRKRKQDEGSRHASKIP